MRYLVNVNGKQYDVEVEKLGGTYQSLTRTSAYMQSVAQAQAAPAPAPTAAPAPTPAPTAAPVAPAPAAPQAAAGENDVVSPMPGKIFKVLVSPGQAVTEGEPVIILEAMKMENEIVAQADGTVDKILVNVGDMVNTDDTLVTMK